MRSFVLAALAVLFAWPAMAELSMGQATLICSKSAGDFTKLYGEIKEFEHGDMNSDGFGVVFGRSDTHRALFMLAPDGTICAVWDKIVANGERS